MDEGHGNDQNNGRGDTPGPSTEEAQQTVPMETVKHKDKGKEIIGGECKKTFFFFAKRTRNLRPTI
jgi:hypothetical protein